jgi:cell shape-determining protein MreC
VINNKKVFLIYIVCFFLFLTLYIFPNYSNQPRLLAFQVKESIEKPFGFVGSNLYKYLRILKTNQDLSFEIDNLKKENEYLKNINNYFKVITSKYTDQYKIFHNKESPLPLSIGVSVIGDRNLFYNNDFIINKGLKSGIQISNYVIDGINIVGRVKSVYDNTSLVVTVKSVDYGDEALIDNEYYIISGTNNNYLSFLRQRNSIKEIKLDVGKKAIIEKDHVNLILGHVSYIDDQPVIYTGSNFNLDNLRVIIDD